VDLLVRLGLKLDVAFKDKNQLGVPCALADLQSMNSKSQEDTFIEIMDGSPV
jgi:hypothetical protein